MTQFGTPSNFFCFFSSTYPMYLLEFASCILGTMCAFRIYRANWLSSKPEWAVRQAHQDPFFQFYRFCCCRRSRLCHIYLLERTSEQQDGRTNGRSIHPPILIDHSSIKSTECEKWFKAPKPSVFVWVASKIKV